jgi:3-oxoadipate enol-lactonase
MNALIDGISLHFEVHGNGEPVLFVHGFPLSGRLWDPAVALLQDRFELIVPDLRGHGRSGVSEDVTMARYADDLAALLDVAGAKGPVTVVGHSMGGYIAFELYRRHPERIRALVLVDTRAGTDTEEAAEGRREMARRVLRDGSRVIADALVDRLFAPPTPDALRERWHEIMASTPPVGVAAALRAMAERPDSHPMLREIDRPVLVVVGADDAITPPEEARRMHEAVPSSRLEVVPEAGHMTPVEQPERFAEVLRDFVETWS